MAYPTIDKPYGYKPINLIGGQPFSGSTRMYSVNYNNSAAIFYGDPVTLSGGNIVIPTLPVNSTAANNTIGIFLGCYFTNPATKQRLYSQYLPSGTLAGDITVIVADDPDIVVRCAVTASAGSTLVSSANTINIGSNMVGNSSVTGSTATGNSANGVIAATAAGASTAGFRVLGLATDTQVSYGAAYSSGTGTTSLVVTGLPVGAVLPVGAEVFNVVFGGLQYTGSFLTAASTVTTTGSTTLTVTASTATVAGTVAVVVTPEVLVKVNFGVHRYNIAAGT
jgi:hypothetical protein